MTWSSTSVGERPIHSVKTITCGSERSGMASSLTWRIDQIDPAQATATPNSTSSRLRAQNSMMRLTGELLPVPSSRPGMGYFPCPSTAARSRLSESSRKLARVTTRSPSASPSRMATLPPPLAPVLTARGSKRPAPRSTKT